MKNYYIVEESNDGDWLPVGKFGSMSKAIAFCIKYEKKFPSKFSASGPEYLSIEYK